MPDHRRGLAYGAAAYIAWGMFPLYFTLLDPAGPVEILANRIVWSLGAVLLLLTIRRRWSWLGRLVMDRRRMLLLCVAAVAIGLNWGFYIYGVTSEQVVQTSLGYFINPLVTIIFGVWLFAERLRRWQWIAVGLGALAVLVLTLNYGRPPFLALTLATSFGIYGLVKKTLNMGALESLAMETALLFVPAGSYLMWLQVSGSGSLVSQGPGHFALIVNLGIVTVVPLLFFGAAATRIPLSWLGLLQYSAPVLQFAIGVLILNEPMPGSRWIGFGLVWVALAILAADSLTASKRVQPVSSLA